MTPRRPEQLDLSDIQGILLSGYPTRPWASYLFLRIADPAGARAWIDTLGVMTAERDKDGRRWEEKGAYVNVAFSHPGLRRLGLDAEALASFPHAFREGMASERRSRILGDTGDCRPSTWRWGRPGEEPDALLMVFAPEDKDQKDQLLAEEVGRRRADLAGAIDVILEVRGFSNRESKEHFGFVDGISQPVVRGSAQEKDLKRAERPWAVVEPGEFILGYRDNFGQRPPALVVNARQDPQGHLLPEHGKNGARSLGRNGSYLVVRQLAQHVAEFERFLEEATSPATEPDAAQRLAEKLVGRRQDGTPLVPTADGPNSFGFAADPHGLGCPIGAHIRRANPRDSLGKSPSKALRSANHHRLLRRGRPYGPRLQGNGDAGEERGLLFLCLNADIERQFEFVQQTWINHSAFGGLHDETDPLLSPAGPRFTEPRDPLRRRVHGLERFVTTKGGAYFFLPSWRALRYLASLPGVSPVNERSTS